MGKPEAAPEEEHVAGVDKPLGDDVDVVGVAEHLAHVAGRLPQRLEQLLRPLLAAAYRGGAQGRCSSKSSAASCAVKHLVEATPISGPACV